jgi:hypothetical protein
VEGDPAPPIDVGIGMGILENLRQLPGIGNQLIPAEGPRPRRA